MSYSTGETSTVNLSGGTMTFLNEGDWTFLVMAAVLYLI
jgi:hypothetical protein